MRRRLWVHGGIWFGLVLLSSCAFAAKPITRPKPTTAQLSLCVKDADGANFDCAEVHLKGPDHPGYGRASDSGCVNFLYLRPGRYRFRVSHGKTSEPVAVSGYGLDKPGRRDDVNWSSEVELSAGDAKAIRVSVIPETACQAD